MLRWPIHLLTLSAVLAPTASPVAPPPSRPAAIRLVQEEDGTPRSLQTAVLSYAPEEGDIQVDLIAAVHIADAAYYQGLQELFEGYDALLFELVMSEGTEVPSGSADLLQDPLSQLMSLGLSTLGLASQTDQINYRRPQFVHADLSPAQMWRAIEERGDDAVTLTLSAVADLMRENNRRPSRPTGGMDSLGAELLELLAADDGSLALRRLLAREIAREGGELGETLHTILITDRNAACMRVLGRELQAGKKRIGVFYGAAHMADFHHRLVHDLGWRRVHTAWRTAWDLR